MMMLTTQLAYNPSVSALAKPQERPNSSPANTAAAIGLVETDSYKTGEQSTQVAGNPQARSGKFFTFGLVGVALATAFVTLLFSNRDFKDKVFQFFRGITGGNHNESSHRNNSKFADDEESPPEVKPSRSEKLSTVVKKQRHNKELATT